MLGDMLGANMKFNNLQELRELICLSNEFLNFAKRYYKKNINMKFYCEDIFKISKKHNKNLIVLSGDKGNSLAFAPGYNINSFKPGLGGTTIISAHRDTHFRFLEDVSLDDVFEVTDRNNKTTSYVVNDIRIIDSDQQDIAVYDNQAEIKLITCYPFNAPIAGGPLRYIVTAKLI